MVELIWLWSRDWNEKIIGFRFCVRLSGVSWMEIAYRFKPYIIGINNGIVTPGNIEYVRHESSGLRHKVGSRRVRVAHEPHLRKAGMFRIQR